MFSALTAIENGRRVRRPCRVSELCGVAGASLEQISSIVDIFRRPGREFLQPALPTVITAHTVVDLSHESLMRVWTKLADWARQESEDGEMYLRLHSDAVRYATGEKALWNMPELGVAQNWMERVSPSPTWARRYGGRYVETMDYLQRSATAFELRQHHERVAEAQQSQLRRRIDELETQHGAVEDARRATKYRSLGWIGGVTVLAVVMASAAVLRLNTEELDRRAGNLELAIDKARQRGQEMEAYRENVERQRAGQRAQQLDLRTRVANQLKSALWYADQRHTKRNRAEVKAKVKGAITLLDAPN